MALPKTVALVSLGCSKNRVDSELLLGLLTGAGIAIVNDPAKAELIVVNTCGFIEPAKEESIDTLFEMARYKQSGRCKCLLATGCLAQRYGEALAADMPEVDGFLGVADYSRALEAITAAMDGARPLITGGCDAFLKSKRVLTTPSHSAYVRISDGCDNRCAYCAIPLIRGGYRSRPMADVLAECETLSEGGASELTLIAQDTSRYGNDFPGGALLLPDLLAAMNDMPGVHWARVLYCYPDTVNERLLDAVASLPKVCKYLDLPLQHIDGALLKAMNRRGSPALIKSLIAACRARGILVRTTMIVGFPGETDAQFETLLDFVRETRFERLGAFAYSPEEGTAAASMPNQIAEEVKAERLDRLMTLQQGISLTHNETRIGTTCEVLIEGRRAGAWYGRSALEAPEVDGEIHIQTDQPLRAGQYVHARITGADAYDLTGALL